MINLENYEAYFLDYIEGNLSQMDTDMLLLFLEKNPHLKGELSEYSEIPLTSSNSTFDKNNLIKTDLINDAITSSNFEKFAIADLENELIDSKSSELASFLLLTPSLQKEADLIAKTTLIADTSIVFADKGDLKKVIPFFIPIYRLAGVAAVLLLMLYFFIPKYNSSGNENQLAIDNQSEPNISTTIDTSIILKEPLVENLDVTNQIADNNTTDLTSKKTISSTTTTENDLLANNTNSTKNKTFVNLDLEESAIPKNVQINNASTRLVDLSSAFKSTRILANAVEIIEAENYYEEIINKAKVDDKNNFLSPKEFLASVFKKKVLKSNSKGSEIEAEDFNTTLASATNNKITFKKSDDNYRLLSIQTKNFSFEKKLRN